MRWPVRNQILLPTVGLMAVTLAGVSVLNAYVSVRAAATRIESQLRDLAGTLSDSNFPLTDAVLRQTRGLSGAEFVAVDATGQITASSLESIDMSSLPDTVVPRTPQRLTLDSSIAVGGVRYFHNQVRLSRAGAARAVELHILYPVETYRVAWWNAIYPPLCVGGVGLALSALLSAGIAAHVTRPLDRLRVQVDRIAEGEFQPVTLNRRHDEVLELGQAINRMSDMLSHYEDEVRRNEQLRTLGQLGGGIAHQMRNAVTGCCLALELHRRECPRQGEGESLDVAVRQLRLMERFLRRFLTPHNQPAATHQPLELRAVVDGALPLIEPMARHVHVSLRWQPPARPLWISGDADSLEQLLINLLMNAIEAAADEAVQATDQGSVILRAAASGDKSVRLEVIDSGPGPAAEVGDRLFEPLVTGKPDGTGLGLSVAKRIVEQHRGQIGWRRDGATTCFYVEFPLLAAEPERAEIVGG